MGRNESGGQIAMEGGEYFIHGGYSPNSGNNCHEGFAISSGKAVLTYCVSAKIIQY